MNLIQQIIAAILDEQVPIAAILRMCLLLAHRLKNQRLIEWASSELDGYRTEEQLPKYRSLTVNAKGHLFGPFNAFIQSQPIPPSILKVQHRHWAEHADLRQPIAAYSALVAQHAQEAKAGGRGAALTIEWPPDLAALYQRSVIEGYALNRAWQEIPLSSIIGLLDTVRNRLLKFVLELQDGLGHPGDEVEKLSQEMVQSYVTNIIYGGQNIIGSNNSDILQAGSIMVEAGNFASLANALKSIGIPESELSAVEDIVRTEKGGATGPSTQNWILRVASSGLKVGKDVAAGLLTAWITQFFGASPPK